MRRAWQIGFFVAILACAGLLFYYQRSRPRPERIEDLDVKTEQVTQSPRLAVAPIFKPDAGVVVRPRQAVVPSEQDLMQQIRANVKSNPQLAESLAREDRQRFPDSPESDERDALLVDALINQQRIGAARSETYYYLDHHPDGRFAEHLFVMTGVHPRPSGPGR
jgi:hypothetical protein